MKQEPKGMKQRKNYGILLWLFVMGLSLFAGVFLLAIIPNTTHGFSPRAGMVLIGLAVFALLMAKRAVTYEMQPLSPPTFLQQIRRWWPRNGRYLFLLLSILATAYGLRTIPNLHPSDSHRAVTLSWLAALLFYFLAIQKLSWHWPNWTEWWRHHHRMVLSVGGITLLAFLLRVWQVGTIPYTLSGDEASQGLEAIRVLEGQLRNPFGTGWLGVPTMSFFFNSLTIGAFGQTPFALRLPWVFVGSATIPIVFFLVRRLTTTRLAVITAVLLATYHYHIHFSRLGSNQIADPFFLTLSLLFLYRGLDRHRLSDWALSGMVSGLALYFYAGARLTLVVVTAVMLYLFLRQMRTFLHEHGLGILVSLGGFLTVSAPMLQYAYRFPGDFNARINQVGIIQSGWLENEISIRGQSMWAILADQFQRAALAFNVYPDRTVWYGLSEPLLKPLFGALFLLGMGYGLWRLVGHHANPRFAPMVAWWWGGMLLGGMLTESPPSSQRLITLAVPVCFFIGLALDEVANLLHEAIPAILPRVVVGIGVALFAVSSLQTYFIDYTPQRIYGGTHAEFATAVAPRLRSLQYDHHIYFVGAPFMYWGFATLPYLVPQATAEDLLDPLENYFMDEDVRLGQRSVFVVIPPRQQELSTLLSVFPEGQRESIYSSVDGELLGILYIVDNSR